MNKLTIHYNMKIKITLSPAGPLGPRGPKSPNLPCQRRSNGKNEQMETWQQSDHAEKLHFVIIEK